MKKPENAINAELLSQAYCEEITAIKKCNSLVSL